MKNQLKIERFASSILGAFLATGIWGLFFLFASFFVFPFSFKFVGFILLLSSYVWYIWGRLIIKEMQKRRSK